MGAETLVLALLVVLVAGLLRSHARILQALHSLGVDLDSATGNEPQPAGTTAATTPVALRLPKLSVTRPAGGPAFNITGMAATGESVSIAVLGARVDTLIAFLSTGCTTCAGFWDALRAGAGDDLPDCTRLIVVTRGGKPWVVLAPPALPVQAEAADGQLKWPDFAARLAPHYPVPVAGPMATDLLGQDKEDRF